MFLVSNAPGWSAEELLAALGNPHDREILALAQQSPVDAQSVMDATGFPKSTVYRRIHHLEEVGLLVRSSGVVRDGHAVERYRTAVTEIVAEMRDGLLKLTWRRRAHAPPPILSEMEELILPIDS